MADISLLFGVAGGGTLAGASGKLIQEQLTSILNEINKNPLGVSFQVDEKSMKSLQEAVSEVTKSLEAVSKISLNTADLKTSSNMMGRITEAVNGVNRALGDTNGMLSGISEDMKPILIALREIAAALPKSGSALARMADSGSAGIDNLAEQLERVLGLITQINQKDFNIQNVFEYKKSGKTSTEELELYRTKALETLRVADQLEQTLSDLSHMSGTAFGRALHQSGEFNKYWEYITKPKSFDEVSGDIAGASTISSLNKIIGTLIERQRVYQAVIDSLRTMGSTIPEINTSGLDQANAKIEEFDARTKAVEKSFTDAANAAANMSNAIANPESEVSNAVKDNASQVREMCAEINEILDELRAKIVSTFDFTTVPLDISNITEVIERIKQQLAGLEVKVGAVVSETKESGTTEKSGRTPGSRKSETDRQIEAMWKAHKAEVDAEVKIRSEIDKTYRQKEELAAKAEASAESAAQKEIAAHEAAARARIAAEEESAWAEHEAEIAAAERVLAEEEKVYRLRDEQRNKAEEAIEAATRKEIADAENAAMAEIAADNKKTAQEIANAHKVHEAEIAAQERLAAAEAKHFAAKEAAAKKAEEAIEAATRKEIDMDWDDFNSRKLVPVSEILSAYKKLDTYMNRGFNISPDTINGDELRSTIVRLNSVRDKLREIAIAGSAAGDGFSDIERTDFKQLIAEMSQYQAELHGAGVEGKTLGQTVADMFRRFGGWSLVERSFSLASQAVVRMITMVRELDTAMTELRKVTEVTDATYTKFLERAAERAKTVGATLTNTITATADFARLGYGLEEASNLADAALVYKNVGDGFESISEASDSIISTMQAFGVTASDAMLIVDKFNEVGNSFAISSKGIGDAMLRSAASMYSAGNTLDETIALITAANTVVQNPDSVGTTLKTISMFLRAAKTEAEEAGESTEGMATSVSELRKEILALTAQRVDIMEDEDTYKSTYKILQELAGVWDELTDVSQANILEMVGGKRNANVVAALLENFTVAEDVLKTSAEAAGSAMAENEKYLDSINGKIDKFNTNAEVFAQNVVGSEAIKGVIDLGSGFLNVLNTLEEIHVLLPLIGTGIASVSGFLTAKKLSGFTGRALNFGGVVSAIPLWGKLLTAITLVISAVEILTPLMDELFKSPEEKIKELGEEWKSLSLEMRDITNEYKGLKDSADEIIPRFTELSKGVNEFGEQVTLTDEEYAEFLRLNNQIAEMFPELNLGMDANGNAMLSLSYSADTLTDSLYALVEAQRMAANQELAGKMPEAVDVIQKQEKEHQKIIKSAEKTKKDLATIYGQILTESLPEHPTEDIASLLETAAQFGIRGERVVTETGSSGMVGGTFITKIKWDYDSASFDDVQSAYHTLIAGQDKIIQNQNNLINAEWGSLKQYALAWLEIDSAFGSVNSQMQDIVRNVVTGLDFGALGLKDEKSIQEYIRNNILNPIVGASPEVKRAFSELTDFRKQVNAGEMSSEDFAQKVRKTFDDLLADMNPDQVEEFKNVFVSSYNAMGVEGLDFNEVLTAIIDNWDVYAKVITNTPLTSEEHLAKFRSSIDLLKTALKEYQENGTVSVETAGKLIDTNEEFADILDFSNGKIAIQADELDSLADSLTQETGALMATAGATDDQISRLYGLSAALRSTKIENDDLMSSMKGLDDILDKQSEGTEFSTYEILDLIDKYPELAGCIRDTAKGYQFEEEKIRELIAAKSDLLNINKLVATSELDAAKNALASFSGSSKVVSEIEAIFDEYKEANGKAISSMDEFGEAYGTHYEDKFVFDADKMNSGYIETVSLMIEAAKAAEKAEAIVSGLNDPNEYREGYTPNKDSAKKEETAFEKAYKYHQHLLNMDKESIEDYLAWLKPAYQASYAAGEMELDDFYKYKEECYEKDKELFADSLTDTEHEISLLENAYADNSGKIVSLYEDMQRRVHEKAEEYRAAGLDGNHELIQELQNQWWTYENELNRIRENEYTQAIDEANAYIESLKLDNADVDTVIAAYRDMIRTIEGEISYYSPRADAEARSKIRDLSEDLRDAKNEIVEYLNDIVEETNDIVDGFQNVYSTLTDAAKEYASTGYLSVDSLQSILALGPKYLQYLYDENGQLVINEQSLQAVIAAKTEEMAAETALSYAKQILIATQEGDIATLEKLTQVSVENADATWDMAYATIGMAKAIAQANGIEGTYYDDAIADLTKMQSITKTAVSSISAYYQTLDEGYISQADALDQILSLTQEMIRHENEEQIKALEKERDIYNDIVDQKKKALELSREQDDHDKSVAEKLEDIAKLQARIDQLSLDNSREAQAQKVQLSAEMKELQNSLADEQADYAYDMQIDSLERQQEAYEESKEDEIDMLSETLNSTEKLYREAIERIDSDWDGLYNDLLAWNYEYGSTLESDLVSAWDAASEAVQKYGSFVAALEGVDDHTKLGESSVAPDSEEVKNAVSKGESSYRSPTAISSEMEQNSLAWFTASADKQAELSARNTALAREYEKTTGKKLNSRNGAWYLPDGDRLYELSESEVCRSIVNAMKNNSAAWNAASEAERRELEAENVLLASRIQDYTGKTVKKTSGGVWMIGDEELYQKYHTGGIVGGKPTLRQNEVLSILEEEEAVLDKKKQSGLFKIIDFAEVLSERLGKAINLDGFRSLFGGSSASLKAMPSLPNVGTTNNNTVTYSPVIEVNISHNGSITDRDAKRFGNIAAESALSELGEAFARRGISNRGNAILKK